jgi:hypothetical protein
MMDVEVNTSFGDVKEFLGTIQKIIPGQAKLCVASLITSRLVLRHILGETRHMCGAASPAPFGFVQDTMWAKELCAQIFRDICKAPVASVHALCRMLMNKTPAGRPVTRTRFVLAVDRAHHLPGRAAKALLEGVPDEMAIVFAGT